SGYATVTAIDATIHGAKYTTRRPNSAPVPPPYCEPSTCRATVAPARANTPAAPATVASDSHEMAPMCRATRSGVGSPRANGTVETSAIDVAVTATSVAAIRYAYDSVVAFPV